MTEKLRWGILSTAAINKALISPIRQVARSELVALASRTQEKAEAYALENRIPKAYGSYDALLDDPEVDVVYNSLPNALHCEWMVKAAKAGKHVLCEKPLVLNLAEMDQIEHAATSNNVTIFEAFASLHHPQTRKVEEMIAAGELGDPQLIIAWQAFYLPPEDSGNIRLSPELGGGSLRDVGVYPVSLSIVFNQSGPPVEVWATQKTGETGLDSTLIGQMRFSNGLVAQVSGGHRRPRHRGAHVVGDQAMLEICEPSMPLGTEDADLHILRRNRDGSRETIVTPATDAYLCEVQAMEACVLDDAVPVVPLSLSRDILRTVLALLESAKTGKMIAL